MVVTSADPAVSVPPEQVHPRSGIDVLTAKAEGHQPDDRHCGPAPAVAPARLTASRLGLALLAITAAIIRHLTDIHHAGLEPGHERSVEPPDAVGPSPGASLLHGINLHGSTTQRSRPPPIAVLPR
jgi:hypothetical protein